MKLYFDKRLKDPTYYAQMGFRTTDGKSTTKNVMKLGKHSELLKITDDPVAYCKQKIAKMNEDARQGKETVQISVDLNEKVDETSDEASRSSLRNIGYYYLQYIYNQLRLKEFFNMQAAASRATYDFDQINRFLTYGRILDPCSKYGTYDHLDTYFEQPDIQYHHIMRFLDVLEKNSDAYLEWLYKNSNHVIPRDSSVVYYDCTNFYCETEQDDDDIFDEVTGELLSYGLRKYGVSKEHRPNPIVEMGLLMDKRGIPITMCLHSGNTSEQVTAVPLEKKILPALEKSNIIYCADAGLGSYNIRQFNAMGGRSFIVTQSVKKLSEDIKKVVFSDQNYRLLSNDKPVTISFMKEFDRHNPDNLALYNDTAYKVIPADKAIDLGLVEYKQLRNGGSRKVKAKGTLEQIVIITFSRKMMEYQRTVRNRQIERAKQIMKLKDPEEIKKGPNDVRRFLKRVAKDKDGKEAEISYDLDQARIDEEEKYDGYYAVATNLTEADVKDILNIMHKRYMIEDCFRVMKTNFGSRPVYHSAQRRIKAHFLVCYTALLIYRLLSCSLDDRGTHVTAKNLIATLQNMNVADDGMYYLSTYKGSKTLDALEKYTSAGLDKKRYKAGFLRKKFKKTSG
ncbi:MAG: transposase [Lactimicrobium sp.]|jgi:transposase|uniref:IS1634 family transposase n=1 Tax=Lactimicrobium sp. TaxID=2563780 RepID=UPI002F35222F